MADGDRERWNARYQAESGYDFTPPAWLVELGPRIAPSRPDALALDLASGPGRNALFLARLGYRVDAWDISDVALDLLRRQLDGSLSVVARQVDLEHVTLPLEAYDLVLDAHYLDRALLPGLARALRPGGMLVIHTFLQPPGGHYNPAYALEPGELRRAFAALTELEHYEDVAREEAHLVARRDH
ncbi:MAG TPA: class I SAM-dependent methyltransferase [Chloroflexota bacterium]